MRKRIISLVIILTLVFSLVGCYGEPEGFGHAELRLNLPRSFDDYDTEGAYDAAYSREGMIVGVLRLSFEMCSKEGILTTMSPKVFAEFYRNKAGNIAGDIEVEGDIPYFTYTAWQR